MIYSFLIVFEIRFTFLQPFLLFQNQKVNLILKNPVNLQRFCCCAVKTITSGSEISLGLNLD
jgi:hypothetical protein